MFIPTPYSDPSIWANEVDTFVIQFLKVFIRKTEIQANDIIMDFRSNKVTIEVDLGNDDYSYSTRIYEAYEGLDDETFALNDLFEISFPSLIRSSAFITIYSSIEVEIEKLCDILKYKEQYKIRYTDLKESGLNRAFKYLDKIGGIKIDKNSPWWQKFIDLKNLRNIMVHTDGSIKVENELKSLRKMPGLHFDNGNKIVLEEEFLNYVIAFFAEVIQEIGEQLNIRYKKTDPA